MNTRFDVNFANDEIQMEETQKNLKKIEGIQEFYDVQKELYNVDDYLNWHDDNVGGIEYNSSKSILTVYICSYFENKQYKGKEIKNVYYVIDFYNSEIVYFEILPWNYIDEVVVKQNDDGKYSISFGSGELNFRYEYAKVNRHWFENKVVIPNLQ